MKTNPGSACGTQGCSGNTSKIRESPEHNFFIFYLQRAVNGAAASMVHASIITCLSASNNIFAASRVLLAGGLLESAGSKNALDDAALLRVRRFGSHPRRLNTAVV
jgi:hypothetical protein